jgi:excisionase family DNA binding protein
MPKSQQIMLHTRKEVAALAKVCVHTIARDVRAGRLEEIRFNRRRLRYHRDAVEAYLAANYRLEGLQPVLRIQPFTGNEEDSG